MRSKQIKFGLPSVGHYFIYDGMNWYVASYCCKKLESITEFISEEGFMMETRKDLEGIKFCPFCGKQVIIVNTEQSHIFLKMRMIYLSSQE